MHCASYTQRCIILCDFIFHRLVSTVRCHWMKNNRWQINDPFCYETIEEKKYRPFSSRVLNICRYRIQCNTRTYAYWQCKQKWVESLIHSLEYFLKLNVFNCRWIWRKTRLMQAFRGCNWLWIIAVDLFHIVIILFLIQNMEIINSRSNAWYATLLRDRSHSIANHRTINCNNLTLLCHLKRWIFRFTSAVTYENSTPFVHVLGAVVYVSVSCFLTYDTLNAYVHIFFHRAESQSYRLIGNFSSQSKSKRSYFCAKHLICCTLIYMPVFVCMVRIIIIDHWRPITNH